MSLYQKLYDYGVIKTEGHYRLTSGRHSSVYGNKDKIWHFPELITEVSSGLCLLVHNLMPVIKNPIIVAPELAGLAWGSIVAYNTKIPFAYAEKYGNEMVFSRGFPDLIKNTNVIIVEDVITTGRSIEKVKKTVEDCKGRVEGIVCIWNRTNFVIPNICVKALENIVIKDYEPRECPMCKKGMLLMNPKDNSYCV